MYKKEKNWDKEVSNLYLCMLEETDDVLHRSNSSRLRNDTVLLLKAHLNSSDCSREALRTIRTSDSLFGNDTYFSLSEQNYADLENIFINYGNKIVSAMEEKLAEVRDTDDPEMIKKTYSALQNAEDLFSDLVNGAADARYAYESDSRRYINRISTLPILTLDGSKVSVILDDYTISSGGVLESAIFDSSLEKLGSYVTSLLNVSNKKPISAILCRVNMKDADAILEAFGKVCEKGAPVPACHAIIALCRNYASAKSDNVLVQINDSMYDTRRECKVDCDPLKKVNAVSYFKPRPSIVGFFDPVFPEIIFVRECDYDGGEEISGIKESELYDLHTAVHEYLHYCSHSTGHSGLIIYSSDDDFDAARGFNEGLTEYLAIHCMEEVLNAGEYAEGKSYPDQVAVVTELIKMFGMDFMISCYTSGDLKRIGSAVNQAVADANDPDPWSTISRYMSVLQSVMSGYGENPDGTPLSWNQRQRIMKDCRDQMIRILRKGRR